MGWRPQELAILELEDVHLEERYIVGGMKTQDGRHRMVPVSYTHLDVYKRQSSGCTTIRFAQPLHLRCEFLSLCTRLRFSATLMVVQPEDGYMQD